VVTGATYEFDGQVIVERSQIGEPIRMMCQRSADAATLPGRGRAWRRALCALLTENPVSDGPPPQTFELPGGASE
jgi:hypothetical protein